MHLIELTEAERLEYLGALIDETNAFAKNTPWVDTRDQATKIEYAKSLLLQQPDLPLSAVAEKLGYHDQFHFIRQFKSVTGMTPGEYRKKH